MRVPGEGMQEEYAAIHSALKIGLKIAGARDLEFARSQPRFREHYATTESISCFTASALSELSWHGRKLVGSAQRRYGDVVLQHGSILIGDDHLRIADLMPDMNAINRERMRDVLRARTATLDEVFGGSAPPLDALAEALRAGFATHFGVELDTADSITPIPFEKLVEDTIHE
jgi:lipoate-protein ligase A